MNEVAHSDPAPRAWQTRPATQVAAVAILLVPVYAFALWTHLAGPPLSLGQLFTYPLLFGGGEVLAILLTYRYVCGRALARLNRGHGSWWSDILSGILIGALFLGLLAVQQQIQRRWDLGTSSPPPQETMTLLRTMARDPVLLALWLGPVLWLGVAGFEELARVFFLDRLWSVWPHARVRWAVLVLSGVLFGLAHIYQGTVNAVGVGVLGVLSAWYYYRFGRVWPLILGHVVYDSVQVVQIAIALRPLAGT